MFCVKCGNEVEQHAKFCSKCGNDLTPASVQPKPKHDMNMHVNVLAWLFIGSAILTGILGMLIVFAGGLIQSMPFIWPPDVPFDVAHLAGGLAVFAGLAMTAVAGGLTAAGIGLLQYRSWARVAATIMAVLMIFKFPLGTAVAIYAFWVLFSQEGQTHYRTRTATAL